MVNKQVMKRLGDVDENINSAICDLRALDLDTADELDKHDIIKLLEEAADIVFELRQAVQTL